MNKLIAILILIWATTCFGQIRSDNSLLILHSQYDQDGQYIGKHIVSYNFIEGSLLSKDTIISFYYNKKAKVSNFIFEFGKNIIHRNRYVISSQGIIVDVKTKKMLLNESDYVIQIKEDSVFCFRDNFFKGTGYWVYDLKNETYNKIKDSNINFVDGVKSPDFSMGIEVDKSNLPYRIILNDVNSSKEIVSDCGYGCTMSSHAGSFSEVPIIWKDNNNIIYAKYSFPEIDSANVYSKASIFQIDINTNQTTLLAIIDSLKPAVLNSSFSIDALNNLIFHCENINYKIDFEKKIAFPYLFYNIDKDFCIENNYENSPSKKIRYKDKEIGRFDCNPYLVKTSNGFLAAIANNNTNNNAIQNLIIWNNVTNEWNNIDISDKVIILGWIK